MPSISPSYAKERLRSRLISTAKRRNSRTVNADDAQRILNSIGYKGSRNFVGSVLKTSSTFAGTGYTKSEVPSSKSRAIRQWRLRAGV